MLALILASLLFLPFATQTDTFPTIEKCQIGKEYVINHVVFNCTGARLIRSYKPVACAPVNNRHSRKISLGQIHKGVGFIYVCHKMNHAVEYKPIRCMLNDVELEVGMKLRRLNADYECLRNAEGPMMMKQTFTFHNFCHSGRVPTNSTKKCEGQSSQFIHSDYGIGNPLTVDILKDVVI